MNYEQLLADLDLKLPELVTVDIGQDGMLGAPEGEDLMNFTQPHAIIIRITNNTDTALTIVSNTRIIEHYDEVFNDEIYEFDNMVGQNPILAPGCGFEYNSAVMAKGIGGSLFQLRVELESDSGERITALSPIVLLAVGEPVPN